MGLLLGAWGTHEGEWQGGQAFFVMAMHVSQLVQAHPLTIKCLRVNPDLVGSWKNKSASIFPSSILFFIQCHNSWKFFYFHHFYLKVLILTAQSTEAVENANWIFLPTSIVNMTLNSIWVWDTNSEALRNVENSFIAITPRFTLTQSGSTLGSHLWVK